MTFFPNVSTVYAERQTSELVTMFKLFLLELLSMFQVFEPVNTTKLIFRFTVVLC